MFVLDSLTDLRQIIQIFSAKWDCELALKFGTVGKYIYPLSENLGTVHDEIYQVK